jgi:hypothetical protein
MRDESSRLQSLLPGRKRCAYSADTQREAIERSSLSSLYELIPSLGEFSAFVVIGMDQAKTNRVARKERKASPVAIGYLNVQQPFADRPRNELGVLDGRGRVVSAPEFHGCTFSEEKGPQGTG